MRAVAIGLRCSRIAELSAGKPVLLPDRLATRGCRQDRAPCSCGCSQCSAPWSWLLWYGLYWQAEAWYGQQPATPLSYCHKQACQDAYVPQQLHQHTITSQLILVPCTGGPAGANRSCGAGAEPGGGPAGHAAIPGSLPPVSHAGLGRQRASQRSAVQVCGLSTSFGWSACTPGLCHHMRRGQ